MNKKYTFNVGRKHYVNVSRKEMYRAFKKGGRWETWKRLLATLFTAVKKAA